jgi:very-short-patch-repair endonuclease
MGRAPHTPLLRPGLGALAVTPRAPPRRLHSVHRGVYAVGHPLLGMEGRWLAAVLACGESAVLSHSSAAAAWGLRPKAPRTADVSVRTRAGRSRNGISLHRPRTLTPTDVTTHRGIPITTPARTLLDIAPDLTPRQLERTIDQAEHLRLLDPASLPGVVRRANGHHGAGRLAAVVARHEAGSTFTRSELEERFLRVCRGAALTQPQVNVPLHGYEVDFLWRDRRLVVELDGHASHGTRAAFERDRARDADLAAHGYRVVRFTYLQVVRQPKRVAALVKRLLAHPRSISSTR